MTLWVLAAYAAAGWMLCVVAAAEGLIVQTHVMADWVTGAGMTWLPFGGPIVLAFAPAMFVGARLARGKSGYAFRNVATRGAPSGVRIALWLTVILVPVCALSAIVLSSEDLWTVASQMFIAVFFASSASILLSAARLGLDEPACPNGHPVAEDMTHCSLCDAPIKNVTLR